VFFVFRQAIIPGAMMNNYVKSLLAVTAFLLCVNILDHSLWTPDEPRVAEIAREMAPTGDFLVSHLSGKPFLEKPPLFFRSSFAINKKCAPVIVLSGYAMIFFKRLNHEIFALLQSKGEPCLQNPARPG
jgi:hypothetical protein